MAGLTAAGVLSQAGWEAVLFDKGHSAGGRMATRRLGQSRFDHGAQFFTVRDARFQEAVGRWKSHGWVKPWFVDDGHVRYCGVEGMSGIMKELAKPFDLRLETKVESVKPLGKGWGVRTHTGEQMVADTLLLTPPGPQSTALLVECVDRLPPGIVSVLNSIVYNPCLALLASFDGPSRVPPPGYIRPDNGPIAFIADNTQKGISTGPAALTIHAQADFARDNFDSPEDEVAQLLLTGARPWFEGEPLTWQLHRWKYSQPVSNIPEQCLFTQDPAPLAFAGDAYGAARIEGAFLSGLAAAEQILAAG